MRFSFAVSDLRLPADLSIAHDGIELAGAFSSWTDLIAAVQSDLADSPIDVAVLDGTLSSARDRQAGLTLEGALTALRATGSALRIVVVSSHELDASLLARHQAEPFLNTDPATSGRTLGKLLGLVDAGSVAKVIMVSGYQGGTGKSTMSRYVATELARRTAGSIPTGRKGVLLWELDLAHPTLAFDQSVDLVGTEGGRRTISRILPQKFPPN